MRLTRSLAVAVIGAASFAVAGSAAAETELVVVSWGGAYSASQQNAYHEPYMAGEPGHQDHQRRLGAGSRRQAAGDERGRQGDVGSWWTLVASDAMRLCDEGLGTFRSIVDEDLAPAPDGTSASEDFGDLLISECFIPQIVYSTTFGYRTDKVETAPTSVCDVFDLEKFPGKRSLEKKPINNFEWALLCDGVAPEDVYDVMGAPGGAERALKKLGTIKDQVIWWTKGAQTPQLLADGEVVMGSTYNGRLFSLIEEEKQPVAMLWDWQVFDLDGWVIPKGTQNLEAVKAFLRFATDTQRLADQAKFISYGTGAEVLGAAGRQACHARYRHEAAHADRPEQLQDNPALQLRVLGRQPGRLHGAVRGVARQVAAA